MMDSTFLQFRIIASIVSRHDRLNGRRRTYRTLRALIVSMISPAAWCCTRRCAAGVRHAHGRDVGHVRLVGHVAAAVVVVVRVR